jgi:hypothetical protein
LDKTGILLGATRTHARSQPEESPKSNHFIEAHSFTAIGAISIYKLLALMTKTYSINGAVFVVFIDIFYLLNYGQ